jgi:hypothetical protein
MSPAPASGYRYRTQMGMVSSMEYAVDFNDFLGKVTTNVPFGYSAAIIDVSATMVTATTAGSLGASGVLIASGAGTSEGAAFYGEKSIQLTANKRFFMEVRVQTSLAANTDLQFGLSSLTATTNPEDLWTTTSDSLVAFGILAGSATPKMLADKSNSGSTAETAVSPGTLVDSTWTVLGIHYDGQFLSGYQDGQKILDWSQAVATTVPTGVALAPFFGFRTGNSASNKGYIDYARIVIQR